MKYKVNIIETLERVVEIEAEDVTSAMEIAEDMVNGEEIVLTADDFTGRKFEVI